MVIVLLLHLMKKHTQLSRFRSLSELKSPHQKPINGLTIKTPNCSFIGFQVFLLLLIFTLFLLHLITSAMKFRIFIFVNKLNKWNQFGGGA